jgi:hypothetical protein
VRAVIRVEIAIDGGHVVLLIRDPDDGTAVEIWISPDECRSFVNGLGEAILCLSKAGVMAT